MKLWKTLLAAAVLAVATATSAFAARTDLVIGIPVTGRHLPGSQGVLGNFLNNLPVRSQVRLDEAFSLYLGR